MKKTLFFLLHALMTLPAGACNFGSVHPVLWHYNEMDNVFLGKVTKVGDPRTDDFSYREAATNIPTYKVRLEVQVSYRGEMPATVDIGKLALAQISFVEGETYLVYASYQPDDSLLVTGSILHVLDPRMSRHEILKEIAQKRSGWFVEYSTKGEKWAEGELKDGIPTGKWTYYEITGEKKEEGGFKNGKRDGKWETFFTTDPQWFNFFEAVIKGRAGQYKMVSHQKIADPNSFYVFELKYLDLATNREVTAPYLYKKSLVQRRVVYKMGQLHGKEFYFDDHGTQTGVIRWKNNHKNGKYWYKTVQFTKEGVRMETVFKGVYVEDQIKDETVFYFENGKLEGVEETYKNFEM